MDRWPMILNVLPVLALAAAAQEPADAGAADLRLLVRKVDTLLRAANGTQFDLEDPAFGRTTFRTPTNRVLWHLRSEDQRVVGITIEPVGDETEGTATLTAALLVSLAAVDSLEEGLQMASLVRTAQESDGQSRRVSLRNGVKLLRLRPEEAPARYRITF